MRKLTLLAPLTLAAVLVTASGQAASSPLSAQDAHWLQSAISGDRFEIMGGKQALAKSDNSIVRALGGQLVQDHSRSLKETVAMAKQLDVKVPSSPTPVQVWLLDTLRQTNGTAFDLAYTSLEVKDHQQDIAEATYEAMHGSNPQVKASAKKTVATLKMHLSMSKAAAQKAASS